MTAKKNEPKPLTGKCHFCEKALDDDNYCFGCKHYVCEGCDKAIFGLGHGHNVQHHLESPPEYDE